MISRSSSRAPLVWALVFAILSIAGWRLVRAFNRTHEQAGLARLVANAKTPRVVSLLPQATDIVLSMGCGDHLVAVSNVDDAPDAKTLPRVGDYQTIDWETISALSPQWIVTHYGPGRTPAGFLQRAGAVGAGQLNLQTETLDGSDKTTTIYDAIAELGKACNESAKAAAAIASLHAKLKSVHDRVWADAPISALIVIGPDGTTVAGKETFLSELLQTAGGVNAAAGLASRYPNVDREQIIGMKPEVILQLMPSATPQVLSQAARFWSSYDDTPAVKHNRVVALTDWYMLLPGYHVGEIAEKFANALHPSMGKSKSN
ncbi:MAG TPA: helical backbone metal receptor [Tepidisphaeraceae bacterium]|jgi:iron complex transport system substrate-binding protein|nr:helical backbone metal receptor [Tepidisphaeraceae bacterium]